MNKVIISHDIYKWVLQKFSAKCIGNLLLTEEREVCLFYINLQKLKIKVLIWNSAWELTGQDFYGI